MKCPYCDDEAERTVGWYFNCVNDHTFHIDDAAGIRKQRENPDLIS